LMTFGAENQPACSLDGMRKAMQKLSQAQSVKECAKVLEFPMLFPVVQYQCPDTYFHHFESIAPSLWPDNYLCLGDAVCAFNPSFGQGMSSAARQAKILDQMLRQHKENNPNASVGSLAFEIQQAFAPVIDEMWQLGTNEDMSRPTSKVLSGARPSFGTRFQSFFGEQLLKFACSSPNHQDYIDVFRVIAMVASPTSLSPRILMICAWRALKRTLHLM